MNIVGKGNSTQNNLYCDVCKINIQTEAEYALHEFSKKHCDNLLRIAKNKPVVTKQKALKPEMPTINKEQPKINAIMTHGNIAKYGYFVSGEVYDTNTESKAFNTEYDPYLQKFAENPLKQRTQCPVVQPVELPLLPTSNVTSFKRKKKKKTKTCQICNITLLTVPDYEAHMRSPQHSWKLKMSGMGVSAHFVKASSHLHTVDTQDDSPASDDCKDNFQADDIGTSTSPVIFPTLYCDICELLLNSEQQFNAHVSGKSHNDNVQRKAEIKAKKVQLENVSLNQLYCFSCKVALNNLQQYNEHKFGKKHKMKCRRLMREGITIPPEERVASWGMPRMDPNKPVVYPELYEKFLLATQQKGYSIDGNECKVDNANVTDNYCCTACSFSCSNVSEYHVHLNSEEHQKMVCGESQKQEAAVAVPRLVFHNRNNAPQEESGGQENSEVSAVEESHYKHINELNIIGFSETIKCSVCGLDFMEESMFDSHLLTEDHFRKILELKEKGTNDDDILEMLFKDRSVVKPDNLGRYSCNICSVKTGNVVEYRRHVSSVVHRQTEEDYQNRKKIEVKSAVAPDETGVITCKLCREGYTTIAEYNQHLHTAKHREDIKTEKATKLKVKKRLLLQQKRVKQKYIISGLKRRNFACWRRNCEKNPGLRTKILGTATDPPTESKHSPEGPEPETNPTGLDGRKRAHEEERPKSEKRVRHYSWNRGTSEPFKIVKPLMAVNNTVPFLSWPPPLMSTAAWRPCYPQFRPNFSGGLPNNSRLRYPSIRYQRDPSFRQSRPRYPPCYN